MNIISKYNEQIKKVLHTVVIAMIISIFMVFPAYAENSQKVVDNADKLTDAQEKSLTEKIDNFVEKNKVDIIFVTTDSYDGDIERYADDFYSENEYGIGDSKDGIIVVVGFSPSRLVTLRTKGKGKTYYTDYGCEVIRKQITPSLSDGDYNKAFSEFIDYADEFYKEAKSDKPYDVDHKYKSTADKIKAELIIFGVSLVIGLISVFVMYKKMNNVHTATAAAEYIKRDSLNITNSKDIYLYKNITKTRREKDNDSGSSGGGGSSHGGSTGSF